MSAIHIKIVDGNNSRLLEMTQYHSRTKQEMIKFLDEIEALVEALASTKPKVIRD